MYSKHVDREKSRDRKAECGAKMRPIGLTFKHEGVDKYGRPKRGEIMLIHECTNCGKISINRIAGDDEPQEILNIFEKSKEISEDQKKKLDKAGIRSLDERDTGEVNTQIFGKK